MSEAALSLRIERLVPPVADADLHDLARLLVETVESRSAVSVIA